MQYGQIGHKSNNGLVCEGCLVLFLGLDHDHVLGHGHGLARYLGLVVLDDLFHALCEREMLLFYESLRDLLCNRHAYGHKCHSGCKHRQILEEEALVRRKGQ